MRYLLDTNIVIALLNGRSDIAVRRLAAMRPTTAVSAIVLHELSFGAYNSRDPIGNLRKFHLLDLPVLEMTDSDAIHAGRLRALLKRAGTPIGPYDVLIAGQAIARDLIVVTNNLREFERVADLRVEDWTAR